MKKKLIKRFLPLYVILFFIMAYFFVFNYIPIIMGALISFKNMKVGSTISAAPWVGLDNYKAIFRDSEMNKIIFNTLRISVNRLFWGFWPPIVLAICIFDLSSRWFKKFSQTMVYIPYFFSWVVVYGLVFSIFSGNGLINGLFRTLGIQTQDFLTNSKAFIPLLVGSQIWKNVGWGTILYFAALTSVNPELYEAAKIDGAGPFRRVLAVTLPSIMPIVTFSLIMALGSILNNDFEQILMYYNSAVYDVADIIDTWVYRIGIGKMQYGIGSAVTFLKAAISLVLIVTANKISHKVSDRGMW